MAIKLTRMRADRPVTAKVLLELFVPDGFGALTVEVLAEAARRKLQADCGEPVKTSTEPDCGGEVLSWACRAVRAAGDELPAELFARLVGTRYGEDEVQAAFAA